MSNKKPALDFREFVEALQEDGDLLAIKEEVDANEEAPCIVGLVEGRDKAPLFLKLAGTPGYRVLGLPTSSKPGSSKVARLAQHLGLPANSSRKDIQIKLLEEKYLHRFEPKVITEHAPVQKFIIGKDDVDLTKIPLLHQAGKTQYIQTYGIHVVQAPPNEKRWISWSLSRGLIVSNKNTLICPVFADRQVRQIFEMWRKNAQKTGAPAECPWALCISAPPVATFIAGASLPDGVSECDYAGKLAGTPIEVVKCISNDCYVPAHTELVLEGKITMVDKLDSSIFGDDGTTWQGDAKPFPVFTVETITHRPDAILPLEPTRPVDEVRTIVGTASPAAILKKLQDGGIPAIDVHIPSESSYVWAVVQIDTNQLRTLNIDSENLRYKIGTLLYCKSDGTPAASNVHNTIIIDERTNIDDFNSVIWVLASRSRPNLQQTFFEAVPAGDPLLPFLEHGPLAHALSGGKVVTDALFPYQYVAPEAHRYEICDFKNGFSAEIQAQVNTNWAKWGFITPA